MVCVSVLKEPIDIPTDPLSARPVNLSESKRGLRNAFLSVQSAFFPLVITGLMSAKWSIPFSNVQRLTAGAVTEDVVAAHPTEPLTSTSSAKAAGVPIKVVTASAIRAMEASLDLFDTVIILFSLSFLSLGSFSITSNLNRDRNALAARCWIYPVFVGLVRHIKPKFSLRQLARGTSPRCLAESARSIFCEWITSFV